MKFIKYFIFNRWLLCYRQVRTNAFDLLNTGETNRGEAAHSSYAELRGFRKPPSNVNLLTSSPSEARGEGERRMERTRRSLDTRLCRPLAIPPPAPPSTGLSSSAARAPCPCTHYLLTTVPPTRTPKNSKQTKHTSPTAKHFYSQAHCRNSKECCYRTLFSTISQPSFSHKNIQKQTIRGTNDHRITQRPILGTSVRERRQIILARSK